VVAGRSALRRQHLARHDDAVEVVAHREPDARAAAGLLDKGVERALLALGEADDVGAASAADEQRSGGRPDHGQRADRGGVEREDAAFVAQEHGAVLGHAPGNLRIGEHVDRRPRRRARSEQAEALEHGEDPRDGVVERRLGDRAGRDRRAQVGVEERPPVPGH
jgi:hypothetical protein